MRRFVAYKSVYIVWFVRTSCQAFCPLSFRFSPHLQKKSVVVMYPKKFRQSPLVPSLSITLFPQYAQSLHRTTSTKFSLSTILPSTIAKSAIFFPFSVEPCPIEFNYRYQRYELTIGKLDSNFYRCCHLLSFRPLSSNRSSLLLLSMDTRLLQGTYSLYTLPIFQRIRT